MKIHKIEIIAFDPNDEDLSVEDVKITIENSLESCHIVSEKTKDDKKEWSDNSPLNFGAKKANNYFNKLK